jgi:hypothetical protein
MEWKMAKKIDGYIKLMIPAGSANPFAAFRACTWSKRC